MTIKTNDLQNLEKFGVYKILNSKNKKYYIGSTIDSFTKRLNHHYHALKRGDHKNLHLQRAWNKYGEENFEFVILEVCEKEKVREREQFYINSTPKKFSYNINPLATGPSFAKETLDKQLKSRKKFNTECSKFYKKLKNKEIEFKDIPKKFQNRIKSFLNLIPWNKGKHYESTDHLKVSKKAGDQSKKKNLFREKCPVIYVYNTKKEFLDSFRSAKDLEELSLNLNFPINSRFKKERMGIPIKLLKSGNINKAIKSGMTYKGLYFYLLPLHPGKDDVNEPKSVKIWNDNTEVTEETKESSAPYSVETETKKLE